MTHIKSLVFDLDQTLFDRRRAFCDWLKDLNLSEACQSSLQTLDQNGHGDRDVLFENFQVLTGESLNQSGLAESLARYSKPDEQLRLTLSRLQNSFELAVLTNGGTDTQLAKLHALSLDSVFEPSRVFVSSEIGFEKPDPAAFQYVVDAIGVAADRCIYFGDLADTDITAARAAGWQSCLVDGPIDVQRKLQSRFGGVAC